MKRLFAPFLFRAGVAALLLAPSVRAQTNLVPFSWDWSRAHESVLDLSRFLDAPAGQGGHVAVKDGHFVQPDGTRLRLWGVNITSGSSSPPKDQAPRIADDLARPFAAALPPEREVAHLGDKERLAPCPGIFHPLAQVAFIVRR
jgi:hypothetical protein